MSTMSFIRKKRVGEREYYQLVENHRENGAHRQRVLAHLGKHATVEDAIAALREGLEVSEEVEQYRRAFGGVREAEGVTRIGAQVHYEGLFHFEQWVRSHDYWKRRARLKHQEYEKRKQHLKERIEKLEALRGGD